MRFWLGNKAVSWAASVCGDVIAGLRLDFVIGDEFFMC